MLQKQSNKKLALCPLAVYLPTAVEVFTLILQALAFSGTLWLRTIRHQEPMGEDYGRCFHLHKLQAKYDLPRVAGLFQMGLTSRIIR